MSAEVLLAAQDVHLSYGKTRALRGASLDVHAGEIVAMRGTSGSGKSSLLHCMAGIISPDTGRVLYMTRDLTRMGDPELSALRRHDFGFVFQFGELVPELTISENVGLPLRLNGVRSRVVKRETVDMLDRLGIAPLAGKRPAEVSGGQAQRAAVARALVHKPRVVFADEPTGSLDSDNSKLVLNEFLSLARTEGTAVLLVTHEETVASICDRYVELVDGTTQSSVLST